jgi:hypothetical protein
VVDHSTSRHSSSETANWPVADVVLFRMGLMLLEQPATALTEIRRLLAPRGRAGVMVWAGPEHNPWLMAAGMSAMMHGLVSGGPPTGPGGVFSLADAALLGDLLTEAGLIDVEVTPVDTPFAFADADEHFAVVSVMAPPLAEALRLASPEDYDAVRRTAAGIVASHAGDDGLVLPGRALVGTGHV